MHSPLPSPSRSSALLFAVCIGVVAASEKQVLVFGGNGFIGATTVDRLLANGANVTIVNRGNVYWDSTERISPRVQRIECDRQNGVQSCRPLTLLVNATDHFDAVVDFSAYDGNATRDSTSMLKGKVGLYILVSTDSVYDVCDKPHEGGTQEEDAVRPESPKERHNLAEHHQYADGKLQAEESLRSGGIPYVIIRLPDVFGPRDTTYRWWVYQLWLRVVDALPERPVTVPMFLASYPISFVFVDDVARVLNAIVTSPAAEVTGEAINMAYPDTILLASLLEEIRQQLGTTTPLKVDDDSSDASHFYLYPSARRGPLNVTKAERLLGWSPTPWAEAVNQTVRFYEAAAVEPSHSQQRDEIIQILASQVYVKDTSAFYTALEKIYAIDLKHFKHTARDEL